MHYHHKTFSVTQSDTPVDLEDDRQSKNQRTQSDSSDGSAVTLEEDAQCIDYENLNKEKYREDRYSESVLKRMLSPISKEKRFKTSI
jgi:hypothetical protein